MNAILVNAAACGQRLPQSITRRLSLPLIAAPMFRVSGPELVLAACRAGVIGSFPTANCRSTEELDAWMTRFGAGLTPDDAPVCPNLIMRREADTKLDPRQAKLSANLWRQPGVRRGESRPNALVETAKHQQVGLLQPRFEQPPNE